MLIHYYRFFFRFSWWHYTSRALYADAFDDSHYDMPDCFPADYSLSAFDADIAADVSLISIIDIEFRYTILFRSFIIFWLFTRWYAATPFWCHLMPIWLFSAPCCFIADAADYFPLMLRCRFDACWGWFSYVLMSFFAERYAYLMHYYSIRCRFSFHIFFIFMMLFIFYLLFFMMIILIFRWLPMSFISLFSPLCFRRYWLFHWWQRAIIICWFSITPWYAAYFDAAVLFLPIFRYSIWCIIAPYALRWCFYHYYLIIDYFCCFRLFHAATSWWYHVIIFISLFRHSMLFRLFRSLPPAADASMRFIWYVTMRFLSLLIDEAARWCFTPIRFFISIIIFDYFHYISCAAFVYYFDIFFFIYCSSMPIHFCWCRFHALFIFLILFFFFFRLLMSLFKSAMLSMLHYFMLSPLIRLILYFLITAVVAWLFLLFSIRYLIILHYFSIRLSCWYCFFFLTLMPPTMLWWYFALRPIDVSIISFCHLIFDARWWLFRLFYFRYAYLRWYYLLPLFWYFRFSLFFLIYYFPFHDYDTLFSFFDNFSIIFDTMLLLITFRHYYWCWFFMMPCFFWFFRVCFIIAIFSLLRWYADIARLIISFHYRLCLRWCRLYFDAAFRYYATIFLMPLSSCYYTMRHYYFFFIIVSWFSMLIFFSAWFFCFSFSIIFSFDVLFHIIIFDTLDVYYFSRCHFSFSLYLFCCPPFRRCRLIYYSFVISMPDADMFDYFLIFTRWCLFFAMLIIFDADDIIVVTCFRCHDILFIIFWLCLIIDAFIYFSSYYYYGHYVFIIFIFITLFAFIIDIIISLSLRHILIIFAIVIVFISLILFSDKTYHIIYYYYVIIFHLLLLLRFHYDIIIISFIFFILLFSLLLRRHYAFFFITIITPLLYFHYYYYDGFHDISFIIITYFHIIIIIITIDYITIFFHFHFRHFSILLYYSFHFSYHIIIIIFHYRFFFFHFSDYFAYIIIFWVTPLFSLCHFFIAYAAYAFHFAIIIISDYYHYYYYYYYYYYFTYFFFSLLLLFYFIITLLLPLSLIFFIITYAIIIFDYCLFHFHTILFHIIIDIHTLLFIISLLLFFIITSFIIIDMPLIILSISLFITIIDTPFIISFTTFLLIITFFIIISFSYAIDYFIIIFHCYFRHIYFASLLFFFAYFIFFFIDYYYFRHIHYFIITSYFSLFRFTFDAITIWLLLLLRALRYFVFLMLPFIFTLFPPLILPRFFFICWLFFMIFDIITLDVIFIERFSFMLSIIFHWRCRCFLHADRHYWLMMLLLRWCRHFVTYYELRWYFDMPFFDDITPMPWWYLFYWLFQDDFALFFFCRRWCLFRCLFRLFTYIMLLLIISFIISLLEYLFIIFAMTLFDFSLFADAIFWCLMPMMMLLDITIFSPSALCWWRCFIMPRRAFFFAFHYVIIFFAFWYAFFDMSLFFFIFMFIIIMPIIISPICACRYYADTLMLDDYLIRHFVYLSIIFLRWCHYFRCSRLWYYLHDAYYLFFIWLFRCCRRLRSFFADYFSFFVLLHYHIIIISLFSFIIFNILHSSSLFHFAILSSISSSLFSSYYHFLHYFHLSLLYFHYYFFINIIIIFLFFISFLSFSLFSLIFHCHYFRLLHYFFIIFFISIFSLSLYFSLRFSFNTIIFFIIIIFFPFFIYYYLSPSLLFLSLSFLHLFHISSVIFIDYFAISLLLISIFLHYFIFFRHIILHFFLHFSSFLSLLFHYFFILFFILLLLRFGFIRTLPSLFHAILLQAHFSFHYLLYTPTYFIIAYYYYFSFIIITYLLTLLLSFHFFHRSLSSFSLSFH